MQIALKTVDGNIYSGTLVRMDGNIIVVKNVHCETKSVGWIPHLDDSPTNSPVYGEINFYKNNVILYYTM